MLKSEIKKHIIDGDDAWAILDEIFSNSLTRFDGTESYPEHSTPEEGCFGYYKETKNNKTYYIAYDNSTQDCWVEQLDTEEEAINWLLADY